MPGLSGSRSADAGADLKIAVVQVVEVRAAVLGRAGAFAAIEAVVATSGSEASVLSVEEQVDRMADDEHVRHDDAKVQEVLHRVHGHTGPGAPQGGQ